MQRTLIGLNSGCKINTREAPLSRVETRRLNGVVNLIRRRTSLSRRCFRSCWLNFGMPRRMIYVNVICMRGHRASAHDLPRRTGSA
jgi:hypothetical protein